MLVPTGLCGAFFSQHDDVHGSGYVPMKLACSFPERQRQYIGWQLESNAHLEIRSLESVSKL